MSIAKKFKDNLSDIDELFRTSITLKEAYSESLERVVSFIQKQKLGEKLKTEISNKEQLLESISRSSILKSESESFNRLYTQSIILIVSIAETSLKELFENLLRCNLSKIKKIDNKSVSFAELRAKEFQLKESDYADMALKHIYNEKNPEERINFINVMSIKGTFEGYFGIDLSELDEDLGKDLHLFYQIRNVIVHHAGYMDQRSLRNLDKAEVIHDFSLGEKITVNEDVFQSCKKTFIRFFEILDESIKNCENVILADPI